MTWFFQLALATWNYFTNPTMASSILLLGGLLAGLSRFFNSQTKSINANTTQAIQAKTTELEKKLDSYHGV